MLSKIHPIEKYSRHQGSNICLKRKDNIYVNIECFGFQLCAQIFCWFLLYLVIMTYLISI